MNNNISLLYPILNNSCNVINNIKKIINIYPNINILIIDYGSTDESINDIYNLIKNNNYNNIKVIIKKNLINNTINYALNFINTNTIYIYNNELNKLELYNDKKIKKQNKNILHFVLNVLHKLIKIILPNKKINHIALILDGNRRYSKELGLNKKYQHIYGLFKTIELIEILKNKNIKNITLYAFSEENWKRDKQEILMIMSFLEILKNIYKNNKKLNNGLFKDIKLNILTTSLHKFNKKTINILNEINKISNLGKNNFNVNLCLSYGGQQEINNACKKALIDYKNNNLDIDNLDISKYLLTNNLPPLDILIRFGKVKRVSNFLLYQLAYSELFFIDKYLPQVDKYDIDYIINSYNLRERRLGR
jgi:tritrans,polycis-undecaprenyl-diphosphate synthase [geranylgeranyl-diphosphate specific]